MLSKECVDTQMKSSEQIEMNQAIKRVSGATQIGQSKIETLTQSAQPYGIVALTELLSRFSS